MKLGTILSGLMIFVPASYVAASVQQPKPQVQPATYEDLHTKQAIGRVVTATDGAFFLYEWGQPYFNWVPETKWMAPNAARRLQTYVYMVDLGVEEPTSEYLFYPKAGCTYWLGALSPDNKTVIVYELDHDDRSVRVGTWSMERKDMRWFKLRPDEERIEQATAWLSNDEFLYPVEGLKGKLARASLVTGEAALCASCTAGMALSVESRPTEAAGRYKRGPVGAEDVTKGATLSAVASNGSLAVFVRDNDEELSLLYEQADQAARVLFRNTRRWQPSPMVGSLKAQ